MFFLVCPLKSVAPDNSFKCLMIYSCYLCNLLSFNKDDYKIESWKTDQEWSYGFILNSIWEILVAQIGKGMKSEK